MRSHDIYLSHRELIEQTLSFVCCRHRLTGPDAEDFCSSFRLHLMQDDYGPIRQFQGRSTLRTYLITVVTRFYLDWRNARWGKWRPSAAAKRLGALAMELETLVIRDRRPFDEAYEILRSRHAPLESHQALEELLAKLPVRFGRTEVPEDAILQLATPNTRPDAPLEAHEAGQAAATVSGLMRKLVSTLPAEDHLIVRMLIEDGVSVAAIARALQLEQKPLYVRLCRLMKDLRLALERSGVSEAAVADLLAKRGFDHADNAQEMADEVRLFSESGRTPAVQGRPE